MIIDIGTGVDESVVMWKYNDKDKWRDADIDELIHLYESIVRCKDCRFWKNEHLCLVMSRYGSIDTKAEHYCSWGERREE